MKALTRFVISCSVLPLAIGFGGALISYSTFAACAPPPSGLVSWWAAEGNTLDVEGVNNGVFNNGAAYDVGEVGQAFSFSGAGNSVKIPASPTLDVGQEPGMSVEGWIKCTDSSIARPIAEWAPNGGANGTYGVHFYVNAFGIGALYANVFDTNGQSHLLQSSAGLITNNVFQHVALTYDKGSGIGRLFANGALVAETQLGSFTPMTSPDLYIGYRPSFVPFGPIAFQGDIDELSIYSRALSTAEIQSIYNAGGVGKCTTPVPPTIFLQPTSQTLFVGQTASFSVGASGTAPLTYQWSLNGVALIGATDATLTLTNIQLAQSGTYAVQITNSLGSIVSSNANLVVNPAPPCVVPPTGLISWWQAEGNASDETGLNNGVALNGVNYSAGMVGQAFAFSGNGGSVEVSNSPSLNLTNEVTIELWYKDTGCPVGNHFYGLLGKRAPYPSGANFGINFNLGSPSYLQAYLQDPKYPGYQTTTCPVPVAGQFHHLAVTYTQSTSEQVNVKIYVDGAPVQIGVLSGNLARTLNNAPVTIGSDDVFEDFFVGLIDEPTIYARALSDAEILAIYNAQVSGKCPTPLPVGIYFQPADQTVTIGQTAAFSVGVSGTPPISYQWSFNGTPITGATDSSLVLTNVQRSQAGVYSVEATNGLGSVTSSNAVLNVNFPPATVELVGAAAAPDGSVTVPIDLLANGNENALGFSLNFDPTLLSYTDITLGSAAGGATLVVNSNQIANGLLGVALSLPTGSSFPAGTQEVVDISFSSAVLVNPVLAQLTFGDQPTKRELSDPQANLLAANFIGGTVSIPAANFEGDVSPRPNGDKQITITDWVLVGRYAARLDYPTNADEYQRADCAPRSTLGDGAITVADWVQAGRYAVGLDPATRAGGPTNDAGPNVVKLVSPGKASPKGLTRAVRVGDMSILQGQSGTVSVYLDAQGDENALGFSLAFDPSQLAYLTVSPGPDATGATLDINTNQAALGRAAFLLAMPFGTSFTAGTKEILKLNLGSAPAAAGVYPVALGDQPVIRQVVDPTATPLVTTYMNGSVTVNPPPSLTATHIQQSISLSWPVWATNFTLQEADGTLLPNLTWSNVPTAFSITNNAAVVTLPISGTTKLYRLQK